MNEQLLFLMPPILLLPFPPCLSGKTPHSTGKHRISPISSRGSRSSCKHKVGNSQTEVEQKNRGALMDATSPQSEHYGWLGIDRG